MYSLKRLHNKFITELIQLKAILDDLYSQNKSLKRDIFTEGVFLRIVVIWENFLEEYFLRTMCKCKTLNGTIIKPKVSISPNVKIAYKKLNVQKKSRDSSYLNWLDYSTLKDRTESFFHHRSRLNKIYENHQYLHEITALRNHIAHKSEKTKKDFQEKVIERIGYLTIPNPNISDYLFSTKRRSNNKFYEIYIDYYKNLSDDLCK